MFFLLKDLIKNKNNNNKKEINKHKNINKKNKDNFKKNKRKNKKQKNTNSNINFFKNILFPIAFQLFLIILFSNLLLFFLKKPIFITGQFYQYDNEYYYFVPDINKCNLLEFSEFSKLEIGDNIYVNYYKNNIWSYSLKKQKNSINIKGKILDKNDYFLTIDFNINTLIHKNVFIQQQFKTNIKTTIPIKKYLTGYKIFYNLNKLDFYYNKITNFYKGANNNE